MAFSLCFCPCGQIAVAGPDAGVSGAANPNISLENEKLSIKAKAVPLQDLLESIAKTCDLRIFSTSAEKTAVVVDVDITDRKIEQALATLLRGSSYLVVYNEAKEKTGLVSSRVGTLTPSSDPDQVASSFIDDTPMPVRDEKEERADFFRNQIEVLRERIASGASDRFYENAIKTKAPEFVQNDRKMLATYEERLADLTN